MSSVADRATPRDGVLDTVVIALGSGMRGDDAAGLRVARELQRHRNDFVVVTGCDDAMSMLNAWENARTAIVFDAAVSGAPPGTVHRLDLDAAPLAKDLARCSSHGLGLAEAIELGRIMGRLPGRLIIYAIEAQSFVPGAALSPPVSAAAPEVARRAAAELAAIAPARKG